MDYSPVEIVRLLVTSKWEFVTPKCLSFEMKFYEIILLRISMFDYGDVFKSWFREVCVNKGNSNMQ